MLLWTHSGASWGHHSTNDLARYKDSGIQVVGDAPLDTVVPIEGEAAGAPQGF